MFKYFKDTHIDFPALTSNQIRVAIAQSEDADAYNDLEDIFDAEGGYNYSLYIECQVIDATTNEEYPYFMHRLYNSDRAKSVEGSDPHIYFGDQQDPYADLGKVDEYKEFYISIGSAAVQDMPVNTLEDGSNLPDGSEWRVIRVVLCSYDSSFEAQFKNAGIVYSNYKSTYEIGAAPYLYSADGEESYGEWLKVAPSANLVPCNLTYDSQTDTHSNNGESSDFAVDLIHNLAGDLYGFVPVSLNGNAFIFNKDGVETAADLALGVDMQFDFGMPDNSDDILSKVIAFNYTGLRADSFNIPISNYDKTEAAYVNTDPDVCYDAKKGTLYLMVEEDPYSHEIFSKSYNIPLNYDDRSLVVDRVQKIWDGDYTFANDSSAEGEVHILVGGNSWNAQDSTFSVTGLRPGAAYMTIIFKDAEEENREYASTIRVQVVSRYAAKSDFVLSYSGGDADKSEYTDFECNISKTQYDNMMHDFRSVHRYAVVVGNGGSYNYGFSPNEVHLVDPDALLPDDLENNGLITNNLYHIETVNVLSFSNGLMIYDWSWMEDNHLAAPDPYHIDNAGYLWLEKDTVGDLTTYKMKGKLYYPPMSDPNEETQLNISIYPDLANNEGESPEFFTIEKYDEYNESTIFKCVINNYQGALESGDTVNSGSFNFDLRNYNDDFMIRLVDAEDTDLTLEDDEYGELEPFNVIDVEGPEGSTSKKIIFFMIAYSKVNGLLRFLDAPSFSVDSFPADNQKLFSFAGNGINPVDKAWVISYKDENIDEQFISNSTMPIAQLLIYNV